MDDDERRVDVNDNSTTDGRSSRPFQRNIKSQSVLRNDQLNHSHRLIEAIQDEDIEFLQSYLAEHPLDATSDSQVATVALREAVAKNSPSMTRLLLHTNCDVNSISDKGYTVLHEAVMYCAEQCAILLLEHSNTVINVQDDQGRTPLFIAVSKGMIETVKKLLELKCVLNCVDLSGNSVLHEAADGGWLDIVQLLLEHDLDINCLNSSGEVPLISACIEGHTDVARLLVKSGADVNIKSDIGGSALLYTALTGNSDIAEALIEAGADVNDTDSSYSSPLILASRYGHRKIVELLLKERSTDCCVNVQDTLSRSALHAAAENDHSEIIHDLLLKNADASLTDNMGKTALSLAAQNGYAASLLPLVKTQIGINTVDQLGMSPLHWAVIGGYNECVNQLLLHGGDADAHVGSIANTALILAVDAGHIDIMTLLLKSGCDVNAVNTNGASALHEAAQRGSLSMVEVLVSAGAQINLQSSSGDTPLVVATRLSHCNIVQYLLDAKCDVHLANSNHTTALHEACLAGHAQVANMLLQHGSEIDLCESEGDTSLILASTKGHLSVVDLLLKHGCNVNHSNEIERTALLEASEHGHDEIVKILIENGADIESVDTEKDSAFTLAASKGHGDAIRSLLAVGINLFHKNRWGRNALHEACSLWTGPTDTVRILLEAGMEPDLSDGVNNTPLILATISGHEEAVYQLIRANCDCNKAAETVGRLIKPIQVAVTREAFTITCMLYLGGANLNSVTIWMETAEGPVYSVPVQNNEMKEWLQHQTQVPIPLKLLSRRCVRQCLSVGLKIEEEIKSLPLPSALCSFMMMADVNFLLNGDIMSHSDNGNDYCSRQ